MAEHSDQYCGWCEGCTAEESRLKAENEALREALIDLRDLFQRVSPGYRLDTLGLEIARALSSPVEKEGE